MAKNLDFSFGEDFKEFQFQIFLPNFFHWKKEEKAKQKCRLEKERKGKDDDQNITYRVMNGHG